MIMIRHAVAEDWQVWRQLRLDALRDAPGAFTTKLAEWQGDGDTEPRWRDRLHAVPFNVIAELDREPAGMRERGAGRRPGRAHLHVGRAICPRPRGR